MPDFISAALSKIVGDEPREAVIMSIIIFFILIFVTPFSWMPDGVFRTTVGYAAMYCVSIYISRLILFVVTTIKKSITKRKLEKEKVEKNNAEIAEINSVFDSLTHEEEGLVAMAVDRGSHHISLRKGHPSGVILLKSGLIEARLNDPWEKGVDNFFIKTKYKDECFIRYAGYFNK